VLEATVELLYEQNAVDLRRNATDSVYPRVILRRVASFVLRAHYWCGANLATHTHTPTKNAWDLRHA